MRIMTGLKFLFVALLLNATIDRCQSRLGHNEPSSLKDLHFQHELAHNGEEIVGHHRVRRNVFYDMLEDFSDTVNGYGSDEEDDDDDDEEDIPIPVASPIRRASAASDSESVESTTTRFGRFISPLAFNKISETLGALNTVGRYIVNMTRKGQEPSITNHNPSENVPNAILTLTKNVLGQNVTNVVEPMIKRFSVVETRDDPTVTTIYPPSSVNDVVAVATMPQETVDAKKKKTTVAKQKFKRKDSPGVEHLQPVELVSQKPKIIDYQEKNGENRCRTPDGRFGKCDDLSNCPALLLDLTHLRESLCFKSLFVPGVCCPVSGSDNTALTTIRPLKLTTRPTTTRPSLFLSPITQAETTTSQRPLVPVFTISSTVTQTPSSIGSSRPPSVELLNSNFVDADECGQQEYSSGRIVGGVESRSGQWPWLAAIFLHGPKKTEFWCGGSLIGQKYVLSAAHCTRDSRQRPFAARQFTVRLGDVDLSVDHEPSEPATYKVKEIRAHPRFSRVGFYNDIAIMVLEQPVRKSKYIIPICMPKPTLQKERLIGRRATIVGWGTTYYGGKESPTQKEATLPIWRNEDCNRAYFQPITDNFICAGYSEGGVDACQVKQFPSTGDSGGPMMLEIDSRWVQLGIVSFGNKCGEPSYPGVYTRLTEYLDWIRDNTRD